MNLAEQTLIVKVELTALGERINSRNTDGTHDATFTTVVESLEVIKELEALNDTYFNKITEYHTKIQRLQMDNYRLKKVVKEFKEDF